MRHPPIHSKILVFLPPVAAAMIVTKLAEHGYASVAVSAVAEAFDALRSEEFVFAITARGDIDLVRNIRPIPIVNLEVFFHPRIKDGAMPGNPKRFDSQPFPERVDFHFKPVARPTPNIVRVAICGKQRDKAARWKTIAANALRWFCHRERGLDAQS
ncbi:hypothetical protein ADU59_00720 (plasmid) [Pararhizobium polonicum]|uniref:Uncharacterized protein n=1 Tax=Pararhizobium polonicum TaxID=1612624 RepID=A0A1C7P8R2_9HYPH|nr:hypothetical protein [Pararhizobium polonicum]OBZ97567.1 hypothetical protein ADU59_00720 [Pararhizobium polonicum]